MTSTINASTTAGIVTTADTSGVLALQTAGTTAVTIDASQRAAFVAGTAALPAITTTGDLNTGIFFPAADTIAFSEGGVEAARIDSGGQFGVGITPSAWSGAGRVAVQVGGSVVSSFAGNVTTALANNYYYNGSVDSFINGSGYAQYYVQTSGGVHLWGTSTAASSSANSPATLTQVMTLDASGNLGIGTTSPSSRLNVTATASTIGQSRIEGSGVGTLFAGMTAGALGFLHSNTGTLAFGTSTSDNNLVERARIDSSGNLLVGTTSTVGKLTVSESNAATIVASISATSASHSTQVLQVKCARGATTAYNLIQGQNNSTTECFKVDGAGDVKNTNNSYGAISDIKVKENIIDATPKLADMMQVKVRNYNLVGSTTKQIGVIAQELETVFPLMIDETPDRDAEGNDLGTTTKGVKYSVFVPMLIKAIQEQQALITQLQADVAALKGASA